MFLEAQEDNPKKTKQHSYKKQKPLVYANGTRNFGCRFFIDKKIKTLTPYSRI